jgi:hypothetical protein
MYRFTFLRVFFSPFKRPRLKLYIGKLKHGTPYFYPRKWIKSKTKPGYLSPIPRKIGFDFVDLGWKTKWTSDDYRFEHGPIWSFVFFKWQIAIMFKVPELSHYWECWLAYRHSTDRTKSRRERIREARAEFPCIWSSRLDDKEVTTCYWDYVLKTRYLPVL